MLRAKLIYNDEELTLAQQIELEWLRWKAFNVMSKLYITEKISKKLYQAMFGVIKKCPNEQHLEAIMDSFGYTRTIIKSYDNTGVVNNIDNIWTKN